MLLMIEFGIPLAVIALAVGWMLRSYLSGWLSSLTDDGSWEPNRVDGQSPAPSPQSDSATADLRQLMRQILKSDSDFQAFCMDYFPHCHQLMNSGMDRQQMETLLIKQVSVEQVRNALDLRVKNQP